MQASQILERIAQLRRDRNWTEYRLSLESKIPQTTISSWYKKKLCPSILSLSKICGAFGISMAQFFSESGQYPDLTSQQEKLLHEWRTLSNKQRYLTFLFIHAMKSEDFKSDLPWLPITER